MAKAKIEMGKQYFTQEGIRCDVLYVSGSGALPVSVRMHPIGLGVQIVAYTEQGVSQCGKYYLTPETSTPVFEVGKTYVSRCGRTKVLVDSVSESPEPCPEYTVRGTAVWDLNPCSIGAPGMYTKEGLFHKGDPGPYDLVGLAELE